MDAGAKKAQLHALERACAVRRAILASYVAHSHRAESSFAVISGLQATEPSTDASAPSLRDLLRERDAVALDVLRTQRELESVQEEAYKLQQDMQSTPRANLDERQRAMTALHAARPARPATDGPRLQRDLLHGVIQGLAMRSDVPWYEDPELTELVLSMDDAGACAACSRP